MDEAAGFPRPFVEAFVCSLSAIDDAQHNHDHFEGRNTTHDTCCMAMTAPTGFQRD
jgi:hypothetical protein